MVRSRHIHPTVAAALLLGSLVVVVGLVAISSAPASLGETSKSKVFVKDFKHKPRIKPERLYFAVGAGALLRFKDLKNWKRWNAPTTRVRGRYKYRNCVPDCASGGYKTTGVKLKLSGISKCAGERRYKRITLNPKKKGLSTFSFRVDCEGRENF